MKRIRVTLAFVMAVLFAITLLPASALAEAVRPYESVEHPEAGVTIYHNKDGSETMVATPVTVAEQSAEGSRLADAGNALTGAEGAVELRIEKRFEEDETLVTVGADGGSVSFYPVIQDAVQAQAETSEAEATPCPADSADEAATIQSGVIAAFAGYTEQSKHKPLAILAVAADTAREDIPFPNKLNVTLEGEEQTFRLPVKKWTEAEGTFGDDAGEWRFQPEWDLRAFPLSEDLQKAITGDPGDPTDDAPFVIPYILVTLEEEREETPEASASPKPSMSPNPGVSPEPEGDGTPSPVSDTSDVPASNNEGAPAPRLTVEATKTAKPQDTQKPIAGESILMAGCTADTPPCIFPIFTPTRFRKHLLHQSIRLQFRQRPQK